MTPAGREKLKQFLIKHEGLRLKPYPDKYNNLTIGVGHNLTALGYTNDPVYKNGITYQKAIQDLDSDIDYFIKELSQFDWFNKLNEPRQIVIIDMSFMGLKKLLGFTHMIEAIKIGDSDTASKEIINSKWANQVQKERLDDDVTIMRTGSMDGISLWTYPTY